MSTAQPYSYFDESYFQDGTQRGTAYINYKECSRSSPTFREIARAVRDVFRPTRVLEIGCATGNIVRHLNELGCEAHGIDVSEWAVRNAEHPNVRLASADSLPYADEHFDLVISCHALEHLPDAVFEGSVAEMTRVCSGFQFHMLPMIGTPPYDGEPEVVREQLRKDPTHQQLQSQEWWVERFEERGYAQVHTCVVLKYDTVPTAELSIGQFLLKKSKSIDDSGVLSRARLRNQRTFREVQLALMAQGSSQLGVGGMGRLSYDTRIWKDVERQFKDDEKINLEGRVFQLVVIVNGGPCSLRFAAGQDVAGKPYEHVGEFLMLANKGCSVFRFTTEQMRVLRGEPDYRAINHVALGGEGENSEVTFYFVDQDGNAILE